MMTWGRILHAWAANPSPPPSSVGNEADPDGMKYQFHAAKLTFGIILNQMIYVMLFCDLQPSFYSIEHGIVALSSG